MSIFEVKRAKYPHTIRHKATKIVIEPSGALVLYTQFPDTIVHAYCHQHWLEVYPVSESSKAESEAQGLSK